MRRWAQNSTCLIVEAMQGTGIMRSADLKEEFTTIVVMYSRRST